jgi:hypothetical protein
MCLDLGKAEVELMHMPLVRQKKVLLQESRLAD